MAVVSLAKYRNRKMEDFFRALTEYAGCGEAIGCCGTVRWADGTEQMFSLGVYEDTAHAIKAAAKMKRKLLDDTGF